MPDIPEPPKTTPEELRKLDGEALKAKENELFLYQKQVKRANQLQAEADRRAKEEAMSPEERSAWIRAGRPDDQAKYNQEKWLKSLDNQELAAAERDFLRGLRK